MSPAQPAPGGFRLTNVKRPPTETLHQVLPENVVVKRPRRDQHEFVPQYQPPLRNDQVPGLESSNSQGSTIHVPTRISTGHPPPHARTSVVAATKPSNEANKTTKQYSNEELALLRQLKYVEGRSWDDIIPKEELDKIKAEEAERRHKEYLESVIEQNAPRKRKAPADGDEIEVAAPRPKKQDTSAPAAAAGRRTRSTRAAAKVGK